MQPGAVQRRAGGALFAGDAVDTIASNVELVALLIKLFSSGDHIRGHGSNYRRKAGGAVDKIVQLR